jgi:hypothetical protein
MKLSIGTPKTQLLPHKALIASLTAFLKSTLEPYAETSIFEPVDVGSDPKHWL